MLTDTKTPKRRSVNKILRVYNMHTEMLKGVQDPFYKGKYGSSAKMIETLRIHGPLEVFHS